MREKSLVFAASLALSATIILSGCKSSTPAPAPLVRRHRVRTPDGSAAPAAPPPAGVSEFGWRLPVRLRLRPHGARGRACRTSAGSSCCCSTATAGAGEVDCAGGGCRGGDGDGTVERQQEQCWRYDLPAFLRSRSRLRAARRSSRVEPTWSGTVVAAKGQGKFKGSGALGIQVTSISGQIGEHECL